MRKRFLQANYEVCSNEASDKEEKIYIDGRRIIVYKPVVMISEENRSALQFLDLMSTIDRYSEVRGREFADKVRVFIAAEGVDFQEVKKYISVFPDKAYRNICEADFFLEGRGEFMKVIYRREKYDVCLKDACSIWLLQIK